MGSRGRSTRRNSLGTLTSLLQTLSELVSSGSNGGESESEVVRRMRHVMPVLIDEYFTNEHGGCARRLYCERVHV